MKTLLLGILGATLLCSCGTTIGSVGNVNPDTSVSKQVLPVKAPTSLNGYQLTLLTENATRSTTGSMGMRTAIKTKFKDYKTWSWSPSETKVELAYQDFVFTQDRWKSGNCSGPYKLEKVGKDKLFIVIDAEEYIYDNIYILLDFQTNDSGIAVWGQEQSFDGNIQFKLKNTSQNQEASNIQMPVSLDGALVEINGFYLFVKGKTAYSVWGGGDNPIDLSFKPRFRPMKNKHGQPALEDQLGKIWNRCDEYSYRPFGNRTYLFLTFINKYDCTFCRSATKVGEGDYEYSKRPMIITVISKNGNTYKCSADGVWGSLDTSFPPEKVSEITIVK